MKAMRSFNLLDVVTPTVKLFVLEETGTLTVQLVLTHRTSEAMRVPTPIRHLEDETLEDDVSAKRAFV